MSTKAASLGFPLPTVGRGFFGASFCCNTSNLSRVEGAPQKSDVYPTKANGLYDLIPTAAKGQNFSGYVIPGQSLPRETRKTAQKPRKPLQATALRHKKLFHLQKQLFHLWRILSRPAPLLALRPISGKKLFRLSGPFLPGLLAGAAMSETMRRQIEAEARAARPAGCGALGGSASRGASCLGVQRGSAGRRRPGEMGLCRRWRSPPGAGVLRGQRLGRHFQAHPRPARRRSLGRMQAGQWLLGGLPPVQGRARLARPRVAAPKKAGTECGMISNNPLQEYGK